MKLEQRHLKFLYWLITAIFIVLFIYLLIKLFPVYIVILSFLTHLLLPFIVACLIAYLLYPIVNWLERYNIHKTFAILLIYIVMIGGVIYLSYRVYPAFILQLKDLNEHLPQLIMMYEDTIYNMYKSTSFLPEAVHDQMDGLILKVETYLENIVGKLIGGFTKVFDIIVLITVIPVLIFYFLKDYEAIKRYFQRLLGNKYQAHIGRMVRAIDEKLGGYIRGQLLICSLVSLMTLIIFHLLKIEYALLLAIIMGVTNIIPYFGPIIGAIPALAIAITTSPKLAIFVLITVFVVQIVESNFISPYIVGKSINIHPVTIIFILLLGGQLYGVIGMILAVPILTVLKEILTHLFVHRQAD